MNDPQVSVVIPSVNGLPFPMPCLDALAEQEGSVDAEVIVADCTGPATRRAIQERHPGVRILAFDGPTSVPRLRSVAIGVAKAPLVAVTEDHCVPRPDWLKRLIDARERTGWAAVAGGVENLCRDRTVDWAAFFCEYSNFLDPVTEGPARFLPGMNVLYDLERLGPDRATLLDSQWEFLVHERLRGAGHVLGLDPSVVVGHRKEFTAAGFLAERYHLSRSFAGMRVAGAPAARRAAWAGGSTLLPALLLARITKRVVERGRDVDEFARAFPMIALFSLAWAAGELVGYVAGPGRSSELVR